MPGGIHAPLSVIATWPKPNFVNPEKRPNTILLIAFIGGPITIALMLVRLWVRIIHQRAPGWDDWMMVAASPFLIALIVLFPVASEYGFNKHLWDYNLLGEPERMVIARKYVLSIECIFCVASGLLKISILLFYRRLSSRAVSNTFRYITWITIAFITAYTIALTIAPIVGCQPISAFWDQVDIRKQVQGYEYHCFDEGADVFAASVISVAQDFVTALLPTFLYWNLQIPFRQKVALFSIFAIGYGVVAIGALRAYYSWRTFYETYDVTWSTWDLMLSTILELQVGAFCANAPALKVFFKLFFRETMSSFSRSHPSKNSQDPKNSGQTGSPFSSRGSTIFGKLTSFVTGNSSRSRSGYISESNNNVSVDHHGGVRIQKEVQITRSPTSTLVNKHASTDLLYSHYEDVEMGYQKPRPNSRRISACSPKALEEGCAALPPMPETRDDSKSSDSNETWVALGPMKGTSQVPVTRPTTGQDENGERRLTPIPSRSPSRERPKWQSWS